MDLLINRETSSLCGYLQEILIAYVFTLLIKVTCLTSLKYVCLRGLDGWALSLNFLNVGKFLLIFETDLPLFG